MLFLFLLEAQGPRRLELHRYLPITPIEVALDHRGAPRVDLRTRLTTPEEAPVLEKISAEEARRVLAALGDRVRTLEERATRIAEQRCRATRASALEHAERVLREEQDRLAELARVNPSISAEEIESHAHKAGQTLAALESAEVRLDAVRVILLT